MLYCLSSSWLVRLILWLCRFNGWSLCIILYYRRSPSQSIQHSTTMLQYFLCGTANSISNRGGNDRPANTASSIIIGRMIKALTPIKMEAHIFSQPALADSIQKQRQPTPQIPPSYSQHDNNKLLYCLHTASKNPH